MVIPSVGAAKHAKKVAGWGADAVMVQGGEGGGHTGPVPTTLLLPSVLDAVRRIPVIAAGGFFDGRGLAAALSYGAAGVGMGTRFLLTRDSAVPDEVKRFYLGHDLTGTVVTDRVDGMPHRMLRTPLVDELHETSTLRRLGPTARRTLEFKRESGMSWRALARDGVRLRRTGERSLGQVALAANTPMLLKAGLVDGDTTAGVLAAGQVVGMIDDLPSCEELIDRVVREAVEELRAGRRLPGLTLDPPLELQDPSHRPVAQPLVDADHVDVRLGVPGVEGPQLRLDGAEPATQVGLEQQPETVAAMLADDGGVPLVADLRPLDVDGGHGVADQLARVAVARDDAVEPVAALDLRVLEGADPLDREHLVLDLEVVERGVVDRVGHGDQHARGGRRGCGRRCAPARSRGRTAPPRRTPSRRSPRRARGGPAAG